MAVPGERIAFFQDDSQILSILSALHEQRSSCRFCDVLLRVCGEEIYAHSNVLAAASVYFGSFLGYGADLPRAFSQKSPQVIEIHIDGLGSDVNGGYGEAVRKVIDFMYTNTIELSDGILKQVIEIAKIMQMDNILKFCESFQSRDNVSSDLSATQSTPEDKALPAGGSQVPMIPSEMGDQSNTFKESVLDKLNKINSRDDKTVARSEVNQTQKNGVLESRNMVTASKLSNDDSGNPVNDISMDDITADILSLTKLDVTTPTPSVSSSPMSRSTRRSYSRKSKSAKKSEVSTPVIPPQAGLRRSKRQVSSKVVSDDDSGDNSIDDSSCSDNDDQVDNKSPVKRYTCDKCDFTTEKLKTLSEHKRDHLHSENVCSFCYIKTESHEKLKEHLSSHTGPQPYFCTVCEISFKTKTQLNIHRPKHSNEKPFVCQVCNAGFKWKHALKNHMIVHSGSKDHLCDICGFSTAHKSQLKAHKLIHTGDTFKCTEPGCSFQATKRQNLKYHMLTHTMEKPHQCYVCGQSFSLAKNMKRHMMLHEQEKPLHCDSCPFTTTRHDKLKEHGRKQHGIGAPPEKRHRISDYQTVADSSGTAQEDELEKTNFIQINFPADLAEQPLIPVPIAFTSNGCKSSQSPTVEYLVSTF